MSLLDSLDAFVTGTYVVTRTTPAVPPYDSHGRKIDGTSSTLSIQAVVIPLTGRDLMVLPEAQRGEQQQWLYTRTRLVTRDPADAPDVVTIVSSGGLSESWVVRSVEEWTYDDETFWRCRIARRAAV